MYTALSSMKLTNEKTPKWYTYLIDFRCRYISLYLIPPFLLFLDLVFFRLGPATQDCSSRSFKRYIVLFLTSTRPLFAWQNGEQY